MQKCLFASLPTYQPNVNISNLKSLITCLGYQYQSLSTLKKWKRFIAKKTAQNGRLQNENFGSYIYVPRTSG